MGNLPLGSGWKMSKNIWVATTWDLYFFKGVKSREKLQETSFFFPIRDLRDLEIWISVPGAALVVFNGDGIVLEWSGCQGAGGWDPIRSWTKNSKNPKPPRKMNMEPKVMGGGGCLGDDWNQINFLGFFSGEPCENFQGWFHRVTTNTPIFQSPDSQTVHHRTPRFENPQPSRGLKFWT